ncbi:MAG: selenide, water dikinase SelD, partial [Dehalococcoidia bacterium]
PIDVVARILEGGADKVKEAGGVIAGGHTIIDAEPKYGLAVTGLVHPSRIRTNAAAQPADVILLTKPLGTGILLTAITERTASPAHEQTAIEQMMALTKTAAELTREFDVHAITDVTGFGLAGHLMEVATNSDVCVELSLAALPPMDGLAGYVERGYSTGGQARNREYFLPELQTERALSVYEETLLLDPQTCGGLLIVLPDAHAAKLERRLTEAGVPNWRIGSVEPGAGVRIRD